VAGGARLGDRGCYHFAIDSDRGGQQCRDRAPLGHSLLAPGGEAIDALHHCSGSAANGNGHAGVVGPGRSSQRRLRGGGRQVAKPPGGSVGPKDDMASGDDGRDEYGGQNQQDNKEGSNMISPVFLPEAARWDGLWHFIIRDQLAAEARPCA
jgi:hypothetical protein